MITTLTKHGDRYAIVIDQPLLDQLKINPDTPLEVSSDGHVLTIVPATQAHHAERVRAAINHVNTQHADALRRLATA